MLVNIKIIFLINLIALLFPHEGRSSTTEPKKEIVIAWYEEFFPQSFDPLDSGLLGRTVVILSIFDTLYEYKYLETPYAIKPRLASAMPTFSSDGLKVIIPLKKGVYFADDPSFPKGKGREIVANDFIFSIKRQLAGSTKAEASKKITGRIEGSSKWISNGGRFEDPIGGLTAKDNHTLEIRLTQPIPNLLHFLTMSFSAVVPHEAVKLYGTKFGKRPVGSGPWKLKDLNESQILLQRNENYRDEKLDLNFEGYNPHIHGNLGLEKIDGKNMPFGDRIKIISIPYSSTRLQNILTKEGTHLSLVTRPILQKDLAHLKIPSTFRGVWRGPVTLMESYTPHLFYMRFDMEDSNLGHSTDPEQDILNRKLRKAIRASIDWNRLMASDGLGRYQAFPGVLPPSIEGFSHTLNSESIVQSIEKGRQVIHALKSKGHRLPNLTLALSPPFNEDLARSFKGVLVDGLVAIGYPKEKIRFKAYPNLSDYIRAFNNGDFNIAATLWWYYDYPDAENFLETFRSSGYMNVGRYNSPEFDKIFDQISSIPQSKARNALIQKANEHLIDDCPIIAGASEELIHVWKKNLIAYPRQGIVGSYYKYLDLDLSIPIEDLRQGQVGKLQEVSPAPVH